jgi:hypothetical protein
MLCVNISDIVLFSFLVHSKVDFASLIILNTLIANSLEHHEIMCGTRSGCTYVPVNSGLEPPLTRIVKSSFKIPIFELI